MRLHRSEQLHATDACAQLGISKSQFHRLRASYLKACAQGHESTWQPSSSGGARHAPWPDQAQQLARKLLTTNPPASYSLTTSELHRRLGFITDRSSVRRWAKANGCAAPAKAKATRASVRRWQRQQLGEIWQMDSTPHAFVPGSETKWHLIDIIDDCSRMVTGARLYERELIESYHDALSRAFLAHGLPLALYVDYHSLFYTHDPDALTQLGAALHHYGVSLLYAPTPQAKGKVERLHHYWQNRLPALFAAEQIRDIDTANALLEQLREHHNSAELHRELGMTPLRASNRARRAKRNALRPCKPDAWWHYIWSIRYRVRVADDGTVPIGPERCKVPAKPRSHLHYYRHLNGSISILANAPSKDQKPQCLVHRGPKLEITSPKKVPL
ncbi:MAG: hypothetical protein Q8M07_09155 [Prosthecobacter sp.]|nr:hypothetical protein [Prosthecobacter sp.]